MGTKKTNLPTLWRLFWIFFKAGTFTFAGGLAMLPMIRQDVVEKYQWMSDDDFIEQATLAQTLPGVIALNCACFVGRSAAGAAGMVFAGIGATISAFALMLAAAILVQYIPREGAFAGAFAGIRAASSALILSAAFVLGRGNLKSAFALGMMLCVLALILFTNISAVLVVVAAGVAGYLHGRIRQQKGGAPNG
jgi:chromate transporter